MGLAETTARRASNHQKKQIQSHHPKAIGSPLFPVVVGWLPEFPTVTFRLVFVVVFCPQVHAGHYGEEAGPEQ